MTPEQFQRIMAAFLAARAMPSAERGPYLDQQFAGENESSLRAEAASLLAHEPSAADAADAFLATPALGTAFHAGEALGATADSRGGQHRPIEVPGHEVVRELSRGGQAVVYLAVQRRTGRKVAVKVMREGPLADERQRARFDREAQILAALAHPNIVQVLDRGETPDGSQFLVMNYVDGRPLGQAVAPDGVGGARTGLGAADPAEALRLFLKVCDAVNAAHLRGVVHRDLKPSNILVDERGEPHVLDFGLARTAFEAGGVDGAAPVTITGQFLGSLPWASPEQAEGAGSKVDARSDVYSLGVILYQLITSGRFPYPVAGTMREVLDNILRARPTPPSKVLSPNPHARGPRPPARRLPRVNPSLEAIVLKALAKRREDRYQSAGELGRDVEHYLAGRPTAAAPELAAARRRRRLLPAGIAAAAVIAAVVAAGVWPRWVNKDTTRPGVTWATDTRPPTTAPLLPRPQEHGFDYVQPPGPVVELIAVAGPSSVLSKVDSRIRPMERRGDTLISSADGISQVDIPYTPPAEYDFVVEFTRTTGKGWVNLLLPNPRGAGFITWQLSASGDRGVWFGHLNRLGPVRDVNPSFVATGLGMTKGTRHTSVVQLRRDGVKGFVNGRLVCHWPTDFGDLWDPYTRGSVNYLRAASEEQVAFHRIAVVEVTGRGALLPRPGTRPAATRAGDSASPSEGNDLPAPTAPPAGR